MSTAIRIASYNIRKCVGLDWKRNPARIIDIICELNADVIVLQEADKRLGERPGTLPVKTLEELGYLFAPLSKNGVSHGSHGNAILYRKKFSFVQCQPIEIPQWESRGAVSVTLRHPDGAIFECIGVHLGLSLGTRLKQIAALRHYVEQRENDCPAIIMGDFNEWRTTNKFKKSFNPDYTVISPGASFHTALPILALDYFVLWGDIETQAQIHGKGQGNIHKTKLSRKGSDHLPIVLDIWL